MSVATPGRSSRWGQGWEAIAKETAATPSGRGMLRLATCTNLSMERRSLKKDVDLSIWEGDIGGHLQRHGKHDDASHVAATLGNVHPGTMYG